MDDLQFRELIKKKCFDAKYHNSLKYMIHNCDDIDTRNSILEIVFIYDPYLASKIYMSMCDDNPETIERIDNILAQVKEYARSQLKKTRLLMAYLELEKINEFYVYYYKVVSQFDKRTYIYMTANLTYKQILYVLNAIINSKMKKCNFIGICISNIRHKYTPEYDDMLIKLILKFFEAKTYTECWKLAVATRKARNLKVILGQELTQQYINQLLEEGLNTSHKYGLYLSLKYGYSGDSNNNEDVVNNIIQDKTFVQGSWVILFYLKLLSINQLKPHQQKCILLKMGFAEEIADTCVASGAYDAVIRLKKINSKQLQILKSNPDMLEQHLEESFRNLIYPFSAREKASFREEDYAEDKSSLYALFHKYMDQEQDCKRIVFLYLNSLFRYLVNMEYVIEYLENRFTLNELEIRELFRGYILYGRVIKINDKSVSIRIKNVLTIRPCRMSSKKCYLYKDGKQVQPQLKDDLYFKFDYILEDGSKLNLHFPAFTIEDMREKEKRYSYERNTGNDDKRKRQNSNQ